MDLTEPHSKRQSSIKQPQERMRSKLRNSLHKAERLMDWDDRRRHRESLSLQAAQTHTHTHLGLSISRFNWRERQRTLTNAPFNHTSSRAEDGGNLLTHSNSQLMTFTSAQLYLLTLACFNTFKPFPRFLLCYHFFYLCSTFTAHNSFTNSRSVQAALCTYMGPHEVGGGQKQS